MYLIFSFSVRPSLLPFYIYSPCLFFFARIFPWINLTSIHINSYYKSLPLCIFFMVKISHGFVDYSASWKSSPFILCNLLQVQDHTSSNSGLNPIILRCIQKIICQVFEEKRPKSRYSNTLFDRETTKKLYDQVCNVIGRYKKNYNLWDVRHQH